MPIWPSVKQKRVVDCGGRGVRTHSTSRLAETCISSFHQIVILHQTRLPSVAPSDHFLYQEIHHNSTDIVMRLLNVCRSASLSTLNHRLDQESSLGSSLRGLLDFIFTFFSDHSRKRCRSLHCFLLLFSCLVIIVEGGVIAHPEDGVGMGFEIFVSDVRKNDEEFEAEASAADTREIVVDPLAIGDSFESSRGGSGYQQKDRKPSQNDKTEHGMEKTVQNQGQSPKMPKSESILMNQQSNRSRN
ncbi:hypothetical protein Tco_0589854 [Tanacetum coccineum]